uniref:Putative secreted peptide n=1 Tax=Anopheles braziliensis TaxID=58242 RepID=A0A2M3ZSB6_9DIPT
MLTVIGMLCSSTLRKSAMACLTVAALSSGSRYLTTTALWSCSTFTASAFPPSDSATFLCMSSLFASRGTLRRKHLPSPAAVFRPNVTSSFFGRAFLMSL